MSRTGNRKAFTLLELVLVITLIGLATSMVLPSLFSFKQKRDLQAAAEIASNACDYARSLAVTTGRRVRLVPERGEFKLFVEENPLSDPGSFLPRRWPMGLTGKLPDGVMVEQVYYPVTREGEEETETESDRSGVKRIVRQTAAEAAEERESVLLFDPDGSTRDTFIYLMLGDPEDATKTLTVETEEKEILTVAIVGVIGTSVIVPYYTEEIFEIYDTEGTVLK